MMDNNIRFGKYDVLVEGFKIIQVMAMSELDAVNIVANIKGYNVLDVSLSLDDTLFGEKILEAIDVEKGLIPTYYNQVVCCFDGEIFVYPIGELVRLTGIFKYKVSEFLPSGVTINSVVCKNGKIFVECF